MPKDQMPVGEIQIMDQNNREDNKGVPPESVVSRMSGPLPDTTQDRTQQRTHNQSQNRF